MPRSSAAASNPTAAERSNCSPPAATAAPEAMMLAHGFTVAQIVELVQARLASAGAERMRAGKHEMEIARVRITEAGRRILEGKATQ